MSEAKTGLWYRCRDFVTEQSAGEWDDKTIADDADKLFAFVTAESAATKLLKALQDATGSSAAILIRARAAVYEATGETQ